MIAADHDRRFETSFAYELVDAEPEAGTFAVAEPQDACGKTLERDTLAREADPAHEGFVVPEHLERRIVGDPNVFRIARQGGPPEWTLAFAEERTDVFRDESGDVEGVRDSGLLRLRTQIVAV